MKSRNFEHLVLTVGTSPLPIYISSRYLLERNSDVKTIYLVSSERNEEHNQGGTCEYASKLKELLKKHTRADIITNDLCISNAGDPFAVEKIVNDNIMCKMQQGDSVHIDYTGGTKVMAVHAYKVIKLSEKCRSKKLTVSGSYLDARKSRLIFDDGEESEILTKVSFFDENEDVLKTIASLHGITIDYASPNGIFDDAVRALGALIESGTIRNFYEDGGYKRTLFFNKKRRIAKKYKDISHKECLKKYYQNEDPNEAFLSVMDSVPHEYKFFIRNGDNIVVNEKISDKNFKALIKDFIDGKWFERYIYLKLEELFLPRYPIFKLYGNFVGLKPEWGNNKFEIDGMILKGYETIGLSVTTSREKNMCKNKGFEIMLRTQQFGGAESKFILITFADDDTKKEINDELKMDTGKSKPSILVLGKEQIKGETLIEEIYEFIS